MDGDVGSSNDSVTSLEDKTEDFCDNNPTRDTLTEGLLQLVKPTIDQLDEKVRTLRISQIELKQQIESLSDDLRKIQDVTPTKELDLESYVKRLMTVKHKVTVVSNVLQASQDRLVKLQSDINKDTSKHRALVETETPVPASSSDPQ